MRDAFLTLACIAPACLFGLALYDREWFWAALWLPFAYTGLRVWYQDAVPPRKD